MIEQRHYLTTATYKMFESVTLYNYTFVVQLCSPKSYNSNMFYHLFKLVTIIYTTIILPYVLDAKNIRFVTNYAMVPRNYQRHAKISKWSTSDHNAVARLLVVTSDHSSCAERLSSGRSLAKILKSLKHILGRSTEAEVALIWWWLRLQLFLQ